MHEEKETLSVDVNIPDHAPRTETELFERTRRELIERDKVCYICGSTESLQAHHFPIERSLTDMIDFGKFKADCLAGRWGKAAWGFDWENLKDPYDFVDDMLVNGLLLCKNHHIGKDEGIHYLPHPLWIAQKYGKEGYKFSKTEVLDDK
jgi:hypothetical protein